MAALVQVAQLLQGWEAVPYVGTLALVALLGHVVSGGSGVLNPLPGFGEPQLVGLGGLAFLMTAAAVLDHRNGGYGWPVAFGPAAGAEATVPAVCAAVLLPVSVIGAIQGAVGMASVPRQLPRPAKAAVWSGFVLAVGLIGAAAGIPMRTAEAPVVVCVSTRTPCAVPPLAVLVTGPARPEPRMDDSLRQFVATGDRTRLLDDMRSFAERAGGSERLRAAVTRFLETPEGPPLTRSGVKEILRAMDDVSGELDIPTSSMWNVDLSVPFLTGDRFPVWTWAAPVPDSAAVFDLKVTSYLSAETVSLARVSAGLEAALLLVGLGAVVRRVFPA
ncbi:hypothetical protein [Paractinoplanes toevensis]|uniref:hypothetical protein n=1 Tax=Paractinoplanes toevensis TaxID=571911 RepID=UPI001BB3DFD5|nr:hypothetical protein [Actinoplanes toevensis]